MPTILTQSQSSFFSKLPAELRNKVYHLYASGFYGNADSTFQEGPALSKTCRRMESELAPVLSMYTARLYYPTTENPFNLIKLEIDKTEPEEVHTMFIHLVWNNTLMFNFTLKWRKSLWSLVREMEKLTISDMQKIRYLQVQLHPAAHGEVCEGTLVGLVHTLSLPNLQAVDIYGQSKHFKDWVDIRDYEVELERRQALEAAAATSGTAGSLRLGSGDAPMELIVEIKRYKDKDDNDDEEKRKTATSNEFPPPNRRWYWKTCDSLDRSWGYCHVQDRASYLKWEKYCLNELKELEELEAKRPDGEMEVEDNDDGDDPDSDDGTTDVADLATDLEFMDLEEIYD